MNFGQKAKELLLQLHRNDWLPPFNEEGFRQVIEEINALHEECARRTLECGPEQLENPAIHFGITVHQQSMMRDKRCLLAYLKHRADRIKALRWQTGGVIPRNFQAQLSPDEVDFFSGYDRLLASYMSSFDMDLTSDIQPPKELYIEVRVLKDCGEIMTDNGQVNLQKNTTHFLRRTDVEHLIRQGKLVQVETD